MNVTDNDSGDDFNDYDEMMITIIAKISRIILAY